MRMSQREPKRTAALTAQNLHTDEQRPIEARKQTEHKLDVWRRYTGRYLSIIAKANEKRPFFRGDHVFVVDLFAGAGRHLSAENPLREVPGTAALACFSARSVQRAHPQTQVHVRLSDFDEVWCRRLEKQVADYTSAAAFPEHVDVTINTADYVDRIDPVIAETCYAIGKNFCSLWMIDPFNLQLQMSSLQRLIATPSAELIINLDAGGTRREIIAVTDMYNNVSPGQRISMAHPLDRLFGNDSWRHAFDGASTFEGELIGIARTYADAFSSHFNYCNYYKLRSSDGQHRYLIHLASHPSAVDSFRKDYEASRKTGFAKGKALDWTDRTKMSASLMAAFQGVEMTLEELQSQSVVLLNKQQAKVIRDHACDEGFASFNTRSQTITWNHECDKQPELDLRTEDTSIEGAQLRLL